MTSDASLHVPQQARDIVAADASRTDRGRIDELVGLIDEHGYVVVENILDAAQLDQVRTDLLTLMGPRGRNPFEGYATQRVYGVLARTETCDVLAEHPLVLDVVDRYLQPNHLLSQVVAINIGPGEDAQTLHHDDALYLVPRPRAPISVATMWAMDDFTAENGGTVVIPGSHRWGDHWPTPEEAASAISVEMPAGSLLLYIGTVWHGGGANTSDSPRLGVTTQFCEPWARTVENFSLSMPRDRVRRCSPKMQSLLGYNIHANLMGYVDGRHPARLLKED